MNYQKIYSNIVNFRKLHEYDGYTENHHIIPKCLGGSNHPENLVKLSAREHFILHKLLCKIFPNEYKLVYALNMMLVKSVTNKHRVIISGRQYQTIKQQFSIAVKERLSNPKNHPMYGKHHSSETKLKLSTSAKYRPPDSFETRLKKGNANRGTVLSETHKKVFNTKGRIRPKEEVENLQLTRTTNRIKKYEATSIVIALYSIFHHVSLTKPEYMRSQEHQEKLNMKYKQIPKKICPYCGKELDFRNYGKYHGDKCKMYSND